MFSEPRGHLHNSKAVFEEKVNDAFGHSIVTSAYEPFEQSLQQLSCAWDEAEMQKASIVALLLELRTIL
jgi:hypothetical protein